MALQSGGDGGWTPFMRLQWSCQTGWLSSEGLTRTGGSASRTALQHGCWGWGELSSWLALAGVSVPCWMLAGAFRSMPSEPVLRATHDSGANFPQGQHRKREQGGSCTAFGDLVPWVTHCRFYFILFIRSESLLGLISCRNQYQKICGRISKPSQLQRGVNKGGGSLRREEMRETDEETANYFFYLLLLVC